MSSLLSLSSLSSLQLVKKNAGINNAIKKGDVRNRGNEAVKNSIDAGLLREDKEYIYLDIKQITSPIYSKSNFMYGYELPGRAKIMLEKYDIIVSKLKGKISFTMILDNVDNIICTNGFTLLRPIDYDSVLHVLGQ